MFEIEASHQSPVELHQYSLNAVFLLPLEGLNLFTVVLFKLLGMFCQKQGPWPQIGGKKTECDLQSHIHRWCQRPQCSA